MRILGFDFPPPPPKFEGYGYCPRCLVDDVHKASLVCKHCGYTLRIPRSGWIGAVLLVLSLPLAVLWVFGFQPRHIPFLDLPFGIGNPMLALPNDLFQWLALLFLFLGALLSYVAAGRLRAEAAAVSP